ncbi:RNA-binding protein [Laceyella tengchongensis]|uniref:YlmH family RNA-binding protein n=1 Tax=Laceyella tengchongensis TaxID=574699 RepID=UPI0012B9DCB1|nr:RNA-binding protein [Laceyella tengchongensis]
MRREKETLFMHFRPEERIVVERALDWAWKVAHQHQTVLTNFLDPRERDIVNMVVRRQPDLNVWSDGGHADAERRRVFIAPGYVVEDPEMFGLTYLRIEANSGKKLEHPDVLGALLGLGIKREKLGDILPHDTGCDLVAASELEGLLLVQVGQIGREHVNIRTIARDELAHPSQKKRVHAVTVASLRIDAVLAEGFRISRSKVAQLIKSGKCKANHKIVDQPDFTVAQGDLLSLRGFGRLYVESIGGNTKKGRIWLDLVEFA